MYYCNGLAGMKHGGHDIPDSAKNSEGSDGSYCSKDTKQAEDSCAIEPSYVLHDQRQGKVYCTEDYNSKIYKT